MAKGFFTQAAVILFDTAIDIETLRKILEPHYSIVGESPPSEHWQFGGSSLTIAYRPDVNGFVTVDVVDQIWPDHMGDPKTDVTLFGAWSMGHFGPFAYPNALARAVQQSWRWEDAARKVAMHVSFVRIRLSYVFGASHDAPVRPEHYDAIDELSFMTKLVGDALQLPGAICYFNPNGEVVLPSEELKDTLDFNSRNGLVAIDAWCNVRLFDTQENWQAMDLVGSGQFDRPDQEIVFPKNRFPLQEIDHFLRNAALYILEKGDVIEEGDTMDGPGEIRWRGHHLDEGLSHPPRQVIRWLPTDVLDIPSALVPPGMRARQESRRGLRTRLAGWFSRIRK